MGDPTGLQHVSGVTANEFEQTCTAPPAAQGVDAWVSSLPKGFGDGTHAITVTGGETPAGHDIDLYFYGADCGLLGSISTPAPDESGVVPGGAAYVLTHLFTGANVPFELTATDAG